MTPSQNAISVWVQSTLNSLFFRKCAEMGFLRRLLGMDRDRYQLHALVSARVLENSSANSINDHVVCDLDKTYVETEFESWVKMARIPFERPHEKITVAGASEVLQEIRWSKGFRSSVQPYLALPGAGLHFVSSSPPQLRSALEGKLILDKLDWSSDTFKNQTYNIRMARMDLLRHHIAYKTKAILDVVQRIPEGSRLWLIGDNAEYDSFVYTGVHLFLEGKLSVAGLGQWLAAAKVESVVLEQVLSGIASIQDKNIRVKGILIRKLANYPCVDVKEFSPGIFLFESWMQVAWLFLREKLIDPKSLWKLVRSFHNLHGVALSHVAWALTAAAEQTSGDDFLHASMLDVQKNLGQHGVSPTRCYPWSFDPYSISTLAVTASENELVQVAKSWYHNIEACRSIR